METSRRFDFWVSRYNLRDVLRKLKMTLPAILIGLLIALLIGALYHLLRGGSGWRLLMYLGLSILGFAAGQFAGAWLGWSLFMVGLLNLGMGFLGSLVFLVAGDWLGSAGGKQERRV